MTDEELILLKVTICRDNIRQIDEKIAKLRDMQQRITSQLGSEVVSGTRTKSKLEDIAVNLVSLENDRIVECYQLPYLKLQANIIINRLDDEKQRKILEEKYINGKSWNQIAAEQHMSKRNVYMIRRKAFARLKG